MTSERQSPIRKALSPVDVNIGQRALVTCSEPFEPRTPVTSSKICTSKLQNFVTPLDKFNECSSNLKTCLIKEFIDVLNVASREELLEIKGIGPKSADYILELRDSSPLKSLDDLEKIGLSCKQVHNMFGRVARDAFE